jgi:hypothetical protein
MPKRHSETLASGNAISPGFRSEIELRAKTFNEEGRTVEAVISTEQPVMMVDWERMDYVPEILLSSGVEFPKSRQIPFLDSHRRWSVTDQLGSARNITVGDGRVTATLMFSKARQGEEALAAVRDGHVTDVSVGYEVLKRTYIEKGKTKTIGGREYAGPVNVVTKWRLREVSLTPIGADDQAKLRGLDPARCRFIHSPEGDFHVNEQLRALLVSRGMPAELTDEQAQAWIVANPERMAAPAAPASAAPPEQRQAPPAALTADDIARLAAEATARTLANERAARAAFEAEVRSLCELADMPHEFEAARNLADVAAVRTHLAARKADAAATIPHGAAIRFSSSGFDRLQADIGNTITRRAVLNAVGNDSQRAERHLSPELRTFNDSQFRHASLYQLAETTLQALGVRTLGLSREDVAIAAMFGTSKVRGLRSDGPYHTTGSFLNLTMDAINKSMMVGYTEAPSTWRGPMRQGTSVADFKQINRLRMGAIPNLPIWNDTSEPNKASFADARESYAVESRSLGVSFSYKLLVNDDMDALTRTPVMLGAAAARTVNAVAWAQLTSNPTLSDGVALFSDVSGARKRKNFTTGTGAPSVTTLGLLTNLMRQMRGENTPEGAESDDILNLQPRYLVVPSALETVALQLVNSAYDPNSSVNTLVYNPARTMIPVVEPILDANSTLAWYLFADPSTIDTIEVTFLQGQENPLVRSYMDEEKLSMEYYILQTFAAKTMNHRGIQKHKGEA